MRQVVQVSLVLLASIACQRDVPVATTAGVTPLSDLAGVRLGMRASELTTLRPRARTESYYGYREALGDREVWYDVPGSLQDGQAPPPSARLRSVTVSESVAVGAAPYTHWLAEVRRVTAAVRATPSCYDVRWPTATAWLAVWVRPSSDVFVLGQPEVRQTRGDPVPAALRLGIARRGHGTRSAYGPVTARPCGQISAPAD
jgi:hypothetical protein